MKIYLVGGAVRDELLGLPIKEKDWVVVGATVEDMLRLNYRQVGKDFPVFLHPETKEEYALARTERKVGRGYTGFTFDTSKEVTLEEDLKRRDLTINAMAKSDAGLVDPYHGEEDLKNKILRHVSPAFAEDPVRILRVARFAARYAHLGFRVAPETVALMKTMVDSGEIDALVPERVWKELERALTEKNPEEFFIVLNECGALNKLFPKVSVNEIKLLEKIAKVSTDPQIRFTALLSSFSENQIISLCEKYRIPNEYKELSLLMACFPSRDVTHITANEALLILAGTDAFRREARFKKYLMVVAINSPSYKDILEKAYNAAKSITANEEMRHGLNGKEIAEKLNQMRVEAIQRQLDM